MPSLSRRWLSQQSAFWQRLLNRDHPETGPVTLSRRRIYILPSRTGLIFALVLLAMLLGAINYQNSLAYILTFLLTSLGVVSMIHAFRNLNGLTLHAGHVKPVFAGEEARFPLNVENRQGVRRLAIKLLFADQEPITIDLPKNGGQWIELRHPTANRGVMHPGRITLYSRFPLGLFHTWSYVHLEMPCLVYPHPAAERGLPPEVLRDSGSAGDRGQGMDDFAALRPYSPGDSLRHVHWKALAREQGLVTKQFGGGMTEQLWLGWEMLGALPLEERLSRLTRWVLEADSLGHAYGLRLPDIEITPQRGAGHRHHCLETLASYRLPRGER